VTAASCAHPQPAGPLRGHTLPAPGIQATAWPSVQRSLALRRHGCRPTASAVAVQALSGRPALQHAAVGRFAGSAAPPRLPALARVTAKEVGLCPLRARRHGTCLMRSRRNPQPGQQPHRFQPSKRLMPPGSGPHGPTVLPAPSDQRPYTVPSRSCSVSLPRLHSGPSPPQRGTDLGTSLDSPACGGLICAPCR